MKTTARRSFLKRLLPNLIAFSVVVFEVMVAEFTACLPIDSQLAVVSAAKAEV